MTVNYAVISSPKNHAKCPVLVGLAVYSGDRSKWVSEAVESILSQTYSDFVLAIVIDGPVDEGIFNYLKTTSENESRVALLQNDVTSGLSVSMNLIVDVVMTHETKYFFRMDSDDIAESNRLELQVSYLEENPSVSILGSSLVEINENGNKVGKRNLPVRHQDILRVMPKRCAINHPTVALRCEIFRDGWRYRESLKNTQDYFFWADLARAGYVFANLPQPLLKFRRVNDFYKRRGFSKSWNEFKARFYTMKILHKFSIGNIVYAFAVLFLRLMPAKIVKLAYKIDRYLLNKRIRHE